MRQQGGSSEISGRGQSTSGRRNSRRGLQRRSGHARSGRAGRALGSTQRKKPSGGYRELSRPQGRRTQQTELHLRGNHGRGASNRRNSSTPFGLKGRAGKPSVLAASDSQRWTLKLTVGLDLRKRDTCYTRNCLSVSYTNTTNTTDEVVSPSSVHLPTSKHFQKRYRGSLC